MHRVDGRKMAQAHTVPIEREESIIIIIILYFFYFFLKKKNRASDHKRTSMNHSTGAMVQCVGSEWLNFCPPPFRWRGNSSSALGMVNNWRSETQDLWQQMPSHNCYVGGRNGKSFPTLSLMNNLTSVDMAKSAGNFNCSRLIDEQPQCGRFR